MATAAHESCGRRDHGTAIDGSARIRMKRHSCVVGTAVFTLGAPILAHAAAAPEHGSTIELWVRKPAPSAAGQPADA
jgi:hypothetical protein